MHGRMRVLYPSTWANILFNWNHSFLGLICFNFDSYRMETSARKAEVIYLKKQQLQAEKIKNDSNKKAPKKTSAKIARAWPSCSSCCRRSKSWSRSFRRDSISCATGTIHRCWRYWVGYIILALGHLTCGIDGPFSSMIYLVKKLGLSIANC